ncbi:hypothetical protein GCM10011611_23400 [Aliidongia dinghuensis]|uniref:DUF1127 domain-containing protein n=1 Tax=Aliidongia dinghuensis TaxID=1867774 RepID=A0A8J3E206_9PROT|nr:hypothetical protein [Aliidongia dinghuensis]GGF16967.1 hypothetical protein GCM10011611_23400 [Aliidongia dinghuensis]
MDTILLRARPPAGASASGRPRHGLFVMIAAAVERARTRRQLRLLLTDPHALDDLGLSPDQVESEVVKPFWR